MEPTIKENNLVLVNKKQTIKRFDIVLCDINNKLIFLRVIGLPEETVSYLNDNLYINSELIEEKFLIDQINKSQKQGHNYTEDFNLSLFGQINIIPKDHYLLLSDNRPYTNDSRYYGLIEKEKIKGVGTLIIFPFNNIKQL